MLLIVGSDNDPNTRRIADHAYIREIEFIQIDPILIDSRSVEWALGSEKLLLNGDSIQPEAVYLRHDVFSSGVEFWSSALIKTVSAFVLGNPSVRCLNRDSMLLENNKAHNLILAQTLNMPIPETTIFAGAPAEMKQRFTGQDVIAKPLAGGAFSVQPDTLDEAAIGYASSFVQERLPGQNQRVFVIDGQVFGFEVQSEELDYRTDTKTQVVTCKTPETIAEQAVEMARLCRFDYCALDFRCNDRGDWVFLEINSFPMFSAFDDAADNRLVEAQLAFLTRKAL